MQSTPARIRRARPLYFPRACTALLGVMAGSPTAAEPTSANESPWGVSTSATSGGTAGEWLPRMKEAGITSLRGFPEWGSLESAKGAWRWDSADRILKAAEDNHVELTAILMGAPPGSKKAHAFPMHNLDDWSTYVSTVVGRYSQRVHHWEVWNEGNGGFNDDHSTTADYAKLAAATYEAAKKADPSAKVGLAVASFDAPYLNQAVLAMAKDGKAGHFDYLCVHPYEVADGLADPDGEVPFLWMTHTLREALKASAPDRADAEVWITEVGRRIEARNGRTVTDEDAARSLVKIYTMAIAQGIRRTQWFEGRDPIGEDPGFGLLARDGTPRASYRAMQVLTARLGARPKYLGWLALGRDRRGYGFVFQGETSPALVAWMPAGLRDETVSFPADTDVVPFTGGAPTHLAGDKALPLGDTPVLVAGLPTALVEQAKANADKPFPWGGDYSSADTVLGTPSSPDESRGVSQTDRSATPTVRFPDGSSGILLRGDQSVSFYTHPSFASFQAHDYYVRVTVRRVAPGNMGMNLFYEVANSQGRSAYHNREQWYSVPEGPGWHTHTWHVTDACFSKMWGYDFSFRPEQSVPFVIGKVEVSTKPFE